MSEQREDLGPPPVRMSGSLGFWLVLAGALLVLMLILAVYDPQPARPSGADHPLVGSSLARVNFVPLTGDPPPLGKDSLPGKVTLVNFWGTWCPPCQIEFPFLYTLQEELAARDDFRFVAVSCEQEEEDDTDRLRKATERFLERREYDLPTYHDPAEASRIAFMRLKGRPEFAFPTTLLFDRDGQLAGVWEGYYPGMELDVAVVTKAVLDPPQLGEP
jgi:thiol-disulfide isomerase/thioredoxin